jgi:hypothetical protein
MSVTVSKQHVLSKVLTYSFIPKPWEAARGNAQRKARTQKGTHARGNAHRKADVSSARGGSERVTIPGCIVPLPLALPLPPAPTAAPAPAPTPDPAASRATSLAVAYMCFLLVIPR